MKRLTGRRMIALLLAISMVIALAPAAPMEARAEEEAHVHDHTALVNGICTCGAMIEATVTIGDTTTCYEKLEDAVFAAEDGTADSPALVKLQRNWFEVKGQGELPTFGIRILSGVFTLDFNGCTIFSRAENIFQIGDPTADPCNAVITITDSSKTGTGRITGSKNLCAIYNYGGKLTIEKLKLDVYHESLSSIAIHNEVGELTIHGGSFQVGGVELPESYAVKMDPGSVNRIYGGSFQGGAFDFDARGELTLGLNSVTGVGASFPGGISVLHATLNALLAEGAAYWAGDTLVTEIGEDASSLTAAGDITVKTTCDHSGNTNTAYTDNGDGTHSVICSDCGYTSVTQAHSGGSATCNEKPVCEFCGARYADALGHSYENAVFEWAEDYSAATVTLTCRRCDEATEGHTRRENASVTRTASQEGSCIARASETYTASVTIDGQLYTDSRVREGDFGPHSLTRVEAVEPGCTEAGNLAYYACSLCGKSFGDEAGANELEEGSWILEPLGHNYEEGVCTRCAEEDPDWEEPTEPTDPEPTDPEPTDPEPTDPEPTDPEPTDPEPTTEGVVRLSGKDRYLTGFAVADYLKEKLGLERFSAVVIAYGQNFPDALTGSYLAGRKDAPILLTEESRDAEVLAYLRGSLVAGGKVYILGGTAAVSQRFENEARELGFQVQRLKGANRYETNLAILGEAGVSAGEEILIATGSNYADSLSASATGLPMLLVADTLTDAQKAFLESTSRRFVILGGSGAVSSELEAELAELGTVTRVKGSSRYGTSVAIAQRYFAEPAAAVLAYAKGFPDGLCGGPLAMAMGAPLVLTDDGNYDLADTYIMGVSAGAVTGGNARISDETVRSIFDLDEDVSIPKA